MTLAETEFSVRRHSCAQCRADLAGLSPEQYAQFTKLVPLPEPSDPGEIVTASYPIPWEDGTTRRAFLIEIKSGGFNCPRCGHPHVRREEPGTAQLN